MRMRGKSLLIGLKQFPSWLREARLKARLSQRELAQAIGVSRSFITLLEKGQREPSTAVREKLIFHFEQKRGGKSSP